jgi:GNAT superfamily N-acetyltransferase
MTRFDIYSIQDQPEYFERAVQLFWSQWGTEKNAMFYRDCMLHSMRPGCDLPRFYIAVRHEAIIGTYALLRNELISRQDLFPWLACLYVTPECRGQKIGSKLLEHALQETRKIGSDKLYLCTDLDGYYEKYGWTHVADGYIFTGDETKIYAATADVQPNDFGPAPERMVEKIDAATS